MVAVRGSAVDGVVDALTVAVDAVVEGVQQQPSSVGGAADGEPLEALLSLVEQLDRLSAAAAWLSVSAAEYAQKAPHLVLFPGLAISLAVFGSNLLGDALRDTLDPRLRR